MGEASPESHLTEFLAIAPLVGLRRLIGQELSQMTLRASLPHHQVRQVQHVNQALDCNLSAYITRLQ
ncbi:hypothetical protein D3C75_1208740 [compost metagenome]